MATIRRRKEPPPFVPKRYPGRTEGSIFLRLETDVELRGRCVAKRGLGRDDHFMASILTARGIALDEAAHLLQLCRRIVEDEA